MDRLKATGRLASWWHLTGPISTWPARLSGRRNKLASLTRETYSGMGRLTIPGLKGETEEVSPIAANLSHLLEGAGIFLEGKLPVNGTSAYFHLVMFEKGGVSPLLAIDPRAHEIARIGVEEIPKGICYPGTESAAVISRLNHLGISSFDDLFNFGQTMDELSPQQLVLASDVTNYPYNEGFFLIQDGRLFSQARRPVKGQHRVLASVGDGVTPRLIEVGNPATYTDIRFGLYLNPVIVGGRALSLMENIPGTDETLLHSFRGCTAHLFQESIPEMAKYVQLRLWNDPAAMASLLREEKEIAIPFTGNTITVKRLMENRGYRPARSSPLKPGEYRFFGSQVYIFPKRALYGHTVIGTTRSGRTFIFKIFNRAKKDNGLYLEQIGPVTQGLLGLIGERVEYAGVGANGGDVRTYLGLTRQYKNYAEDNGLLQEKLGGEIDRTRKPVILAFYRR